MGMGNDMYIQCFGSGGGGGEQEEQGQVEEENKEHVVVVGGWRWKRVPGDGGGQIERLSTLVRSGATGTRKLETLTPSFHSFIRVNTACELARTDNFWRDRSCFMVSLKFFHISC